MNKEYWSKRYRDKNTGWDIGYLSTPIKEYVDQLQDKNLEILIPGSGNSYEAEYLFNSGFKNVFVCDIAKEPLQNLKERLPEFPADQLLEKDFFELDLKFDLILEQTFFCAIPVKMRSAYAHKSADLLRPEGKIAGLFFNFKLTENGPPYGGSKEEYLTYFSEHFKIDILEPCYNSIPPRRGSELFFKFTKK